MASAPISVVIPVGPFPSNTRWLNDALVSCVTQTMLPDEVVIIDDRGISPEGRPSLPPFQEWPFKLWVWPTPWRSGVPHAFNFGVSLAANDLVIMLGSDDYLEAWAVEDCWKAWEQCKDPHGYYYMDVKYSDGPEQSIACHAAMVTKDLWELTGGFPPESSVGQCDTVLLSMMLAANGRWGKLRRVPSKRPPYWYRVHEGTDTATKPPAFREAARLVRNYYTERAKDG